MRPLAALAAVVLVSGVSGFGTFAYIAGNTEHVTSADGAGDPVITTTTTMPAETTTSVPEEPEDSEESKDSEESEAEHEDHESGDGATTTTAAPPDDSDGGSSGLSPEETVMAFFTAMKEGDCETAMSYMSEQSPGGGEQAINECQQSPMAAIDVKDAELASEEGDSATVNVTMSQAGQTMTVPMMLRREGGEWKIAM